MEGGNPFVDVVVVVVDVVVVVVQFMIVLQQLPDLLLHF